MVRSNATSVDEYLADLPPERRAVVSALRQVILRHLPDGYVETMNWGMISYEIPLEVYDSTHNGQPLSYAALAAQKNYYSLYLMSVYGNPEREAQLREAFAKAGKKMDMGKSCLRFRNLDQIDLDVIGDIIGGTSPEEWIAIYEQSRRR